MELKIHVSKKLFTSIISHTQRRCSPNTSILVTKIHNEIKIKLKYISIYFKKTK